jgi:SH3-like domain-containing protein
VIVTAAVAEARQAASEQATLVFQAQKGVALDIAEPPAGGWIRVRHADGATGYVRISQVWGI